MADATLKFPRGSALQFTSGEYSDFGNIGCLVTIKDCDLPALAQQMVAEARAKAAASGAGWVDGDEPSAFAGWLVANGHCMPADVQEVHLGSYGRFEDEFGIPPEPE